MNEKDLTSIDDLLKFLEGSRPVAFSICGNKHEYYKWIQDILIKFQYSTLKKQEKGVVIRYLMKISGYSRQQLTRLIKKYRETGIIKAQQRTVRGFKRRYANEDIRLLTGMDARHDTPSGHAIKKLCERAYEIFKQTEYQNLASISVAHLYNLRKSTPYMRQHRTFTKTKPRASTIGERRKPQPNGQPGYIRIDTVHQGDQGKQKGVYHINVVDEITQFEFVSAVEKISEQHLIPALECLLDAFPFTIKGFHSDNGFEYINSRVAKLLQKLLIEFTKSRPRHSNDNGLVETKNGSVVRKLFGYVHISQHCAPLINDFNKQHLYPYINYHRPCFFPKTIIDTKGKVRKVYNYEDMMTPYEKLKSLAQADQYLKPGMTFEILEAMAYEMSDNEAADRLQTARQQLFTTIYEQNTKRA